MAGTADLYTGRDGVPHKVDVLMDIRSNLGGASDGYTGRDGVPHDVDVLMDIRDNTKGGSGGTASVTAASVGAVLKGAYDVAAPNGVTWADL